MKADLDDKESGKHVEKDPVESVFLPPFYKNILANKMIDKG